MTTTTVTGTGRRASIRQPELQTSVKVSSSQPMASPIDKFPPFHDEQYDSSEPNGHHPTTIKYAPNDRWDYKPVRDPKRRPRKSISETISAIRTRNGSVSANAQDLAQALKAPVSYKLIVRLNILIQILSLAVAYSLRRCFASSGIPPQLSPTRHRNPY
jgi:solute carrier family 35 protein E1